MLYNVINEEHQKFCISTWHACSSIISDIYNKVDEATLLPIHSVLGWRKDGGKSSTTYELFPMVIVTPPSLAFLYFPLCQIPMYQDTNAPLYPMYFETEQNGLNTELSIEFNN